MTRVTALSMLLASAVGVLAQAPPVDPAAVPVEQEPHHRLVFANEFVRIIDALLPPLYVSQYHAHAYDNVAVTILPGLPGAAGEARVGFAGYSRGGYSHVITNPNTVPMRFIAVERRTADRGVAFGDPTPENHIVILNNGRVRIWRVRLEAGQSIAEHQHGAGYVSVTVRGGEGPGTWKWYGSAEAGTPLRAGRQVLDIVEIEPK